MKGKKDCYNKGGEVKEHKPKAKEHKKEKKHEKHEEKEEHFNKGGPVHEAKGKGPKKRADKKSRGGKTATPSSPLTGAMPSGLPGAGHKSEND